MANTPPQANNKSVTFSEKATYTFTGSEFGYSDADGNSMAGLTINTLPGIGTLTLGGVPVVATQFISTAALGTLVYTPAAGNHYGNSSGFANFQFTVNDGQSDSLTSNTFTFNLSGGPTVTNKLFTINEDTTLVFSAADFGYSDPNDPQPYSYKINRLPTNGTLKYGGVVVTSNLEILAADIGNLTFTPLANGSGNGYASLQINVSDGILSSAVPSTFSINVTPVNDAPTAHDEIITINAITTHHLASSHTFIAADFGYNDVDNNPLASIKIITLPTLGTLTFDNGITVIPVVAGSVINAIDISKLVYTPDATQSGFDSASFQFTVNDGTPPILPSADPATGPDSVIANTIHFDVTPINDNPNVFTINEDTPYSFAVADFSSTAQSIKITGLPTVGSLVLNGVGVLVGQVISVVNGKFVGNLIYTPETNANGLAYATFSADVFDGTTTVNKPVTINVTPIDDAPVGVGVGPSLLTHGSDAAAYQITVADLLRGYSDVDSSLSVKNVTLGNGQSGTLVADNNGWLFTADQAYSGTMTLNYTITDGYSEYDINNTRTFLLNDRPLSNGQEDDTNYKITRGLLTDFNSDFESVNFIYNLTADHGSIVVTDTIVDLASQEKGILSANYVPELNYNGYVTLSYGVGTIRSNTPVVQVTRSFYLMPVNDPPTGIPTATLQQGTEDVAYSISKASLLAGFTDVDTTDKLMVSTINATHGTLIPTVAGSIFTYNGVSTTTVDGWIFTPEANYNGTVTLNYHVTDGASPPLAATETFTLKAVNDAPTMTTGLPILENGREDIPYNISKEQLLQGFNDVDNDPLVIQNLLASSGTLVQNGSNWVFTPNPNFSGDVTFTYSVTDNIAPAVPVSVKLTIDAVNDPPVGNITGTLHDGTEDILYTFTNAELINGFTDVEGDTPAIVISSVKASVGTLSYNNTLGIWTDTLPAYFNGAVSFTYDVTDNANPVPASVSVTRTANIVAVNHEPTGSATATLPNGNEDYAYAISQSKLLQGFSDVDGNNTLVVVSPTITHGVLTAITGGWIFTPTANYNGLVTLSYGVTDNQSVPILASLSFNLAPVNDPATGTANAKLVDGTENAVYTLYAKDLVLGFTDPDVGDTISVVSNSLSADKGTIVANADKVSWTFTPFTNYYGTVNLSYSVQDSGGSLPVSATQSFILDPLNHVPTGSPSAILADGTENTPYTIKTSTLLAGFNDIDGNNTLKVIGLYATNGTLTQITDGWTFTPSADYNGLVTLSYGVTDGIVTIPIAATQSFNLLPINHAPIGAPTATLINGTEDNPYSITQASLLAGFTDADGNNTLSVTNITATNGSLTVVTGGWIFTPDANFNGFITLKYGVTDGIANVIPATQTFALAPVNDAPTGTATAKLADGTQDASYTIKQSDLLIGFSDVDNNPLSVTNLAATNGTLTHVGSDWTFTPTPNYKGIVALSYGVTDGIVAIPIAATQSFNLLPVYHAPTGHATATLINGIEDFSYSFTQASLLAGFTDVDGNNTLLVTNLTATNGKLSSLTIVPGGEGWVFTPTANFNGKVTLDYGVTDGTTTVAGQQNFTLVAVNDAPTGSATAKLADGIEAKPYVIHQDDLLVGFLDVDVGDTLTVAGLQATSGVLSAFDTTTKTWTFTPNAHYNGSVTLTYTVTDGHADNGTIPATQSFTLIPVNDPPVLTSAKAILTGAQEDNPFNITQAQLLTGFTDADGNTMSVINLTATNGTLSSVTGGWVFSPNANYNGPVNLTYNVTDGIAIVNATQSFSVAPVYDPPAGTTTAVLPNGIEDQIYKVSESNLLQGYSNPDNLIFHVVNLTANNGSLTGDAANGWIFTPVANYNGLVTLNYTVTDGITPLQVTQHFTLVPVNDPPTGAAPTDLLIGGTEDLPYTIKQSDLLVGFSDVDGNNTLFVTGLTATPAGTLTAVTGGWIFTPKANYNGLVTLTYGVSDGVATPLVASRSFNLAAVNDAPTGAATAILANATDSTAYTISQSDLLRGFSDIEGNPLSVVNLTATNGTLIPTTNGWIFTSKAGYAGIVTLDYGVTDSIAPPVSATLDFTVTGKSDILKGSSGNDTLNGGAGNDFLNGGIGFDIAILSGTYNDYTITTSGQSVILTNNVTGDIDTLIDIERVTFDSGPSLTIAYTAPEAVAQQLVSTWLNRDLTPSEGSYVQQHFSHSSAADVANAFLTLPEASALRGKSASELLTVFHFDPYTLQLSAERTMTGTTGNDQTFVTLGIGVSIDDGAGFDVVNISGVNSSKEVQLTANGSNLELFRLTDGAMLSLKNVEMLSFNNDTVAIASNTTEGILGRLVHTFYGHGANADEWQLGKNALAQHVDHNVILNYLQDHAGLTGLNDTDYIQKLYQNTFNHAASATELKGDLAQLANGTVDRSSLAVEIAQTTEAVTTIGTAVIVMDGWV